MWKSRLDGKDVIEDVEKLVEKLHDHATTNQVLITYENTTSKVKRMNYFPDESGKVIFRSLDKWLEDSYSVGEMLEFLELYGEKITDVKFEAADNSVQPLVNFTESCDQAGVVWFTHIIVGDGSKPLTDISINQRYNPNVKVII